MDTRLVCTFVASLLLLLTTPPDCGSACEADENQVELTTTVTTRSTYLEAMKQLQPAGNDLMRRMQQIGEDGWRDVAPEIATYLDSNADALDLARQAAETETPAMLSSEGPDLSLKAATFLASCLVAQGRRQQIQGQDAGALRSYLAVLRMGHHFANHQQTRLMAKMIGWSTQEQALAPIQELVHHSRLREQDWREAIEALQQMQDTRLGLDLAFVEDRDQSCADLPNRIEIPEADADKILAAYSRLDDDLRAAFLQAREERDPDLFREHVEELESSIAEESFSEDRVVDDEYAHEIAKALMSLDVRSTFANMIHTEQAQVARLDMLMVAMAAHRHFLVEGKRPLKLSHLVPDYLPAVPDDPFSRDEDKIRLHDTGTNWWIYSVGPDGLDQEGRVAIEPWEVDGEGDLVSSARHHQGFPCCANGQ